MKMLYLYTISQEYYEYIKVFDSRVPSLKDDKSNRPFVGVVLDVNGIKYYAPLTSPKSKHKKMKNMIDFEKIDGGRYGAINFNNMIPVPQREVTKVDLIIRLSDTKSDIAYKLLMKNQLDWCQKNSQKLENKAATLYRVISNSNYESLKSRCCDFKLLEEKEKEFIAH